MTAGRHYRGSRRARAETSQEVPLSGVLVAALVVIWALVLVPMYVHRHDGAVVDEGQARVLSRRPVPRSSPGATARPAAEVPRRTSRAYRRRRTVLTVLAAALVASLATLPVLAALVPMSAIAAYAFTLRRQAARAAARARVRRLAAARERARRFRDFAAPAPAEPAAPDTIAVATEAAPLAAEAGTWTPVPVPLPTYVTAPPAPRVIADDWHEEDILDEGELPGEAAAYGLGEDLEQRRAVGD